MVKVRISPTIENEYANRLPEFLPLDKLNVGVCELSVEEAKALLADAEYNSDRDAVDVGPYGTPLPVFNAYRALAVQVKKALNTPAATPETLTHTEAAHSRREA